MLVYFPHHKFLGGRECTNHWTNVSHMPGVATSAQQWKYSEINAPPDSSFGEQTVQWRETVRTAQRWTTNKGNTATSASTKHTTSRLRGQGRPLRPAVSSRLWLAPACREADRTRRGPPGSRVGSGYTRTAWPLSTSWLENTGFVPNERGPALSLRNFPKEAETKIEKCEIFISHQLLEGMYLWGSMVFYSLLISFQLLIRIFLVAFKILHQLQHSDSEVSKLSQCKNITVSSIKLQFIIGAGIFTTTCKNI